MFSDEIEKINLSLIMVKLEIIEFEKLLLRYRLGAIPIHSAEREHINIQLERLYKIDENGRREEMNKMKELKKDLERSNSNYKHIEKAAKNLDARCNEVLLENTLLKTRLNKLDAKIDVVFDAYQALKDKNER